MSKKKPSPVGSSRLARKKANRSFRRWPRGPGRPPWLKVRISVVDYHAENIEFRWFNQTTGEERTGRYATTQAGILQQIDQSAKELEPGGNLVRVMECTTGWARVKDLIGSRARFVLANVLQMPMPPKARRRKTDKSDTGRIMREYLHGSLPQSFQPAVWRRRVRRLVDLRQDLVERQTAIKNWIATRCNGAACPAGIPTLLLQPCCGISGLADAWHDADPGSPDHARREAREQPELP